MISSNKTPKCATRGCAQTTKKTVARTQASNRGSKAFRNSGKNACSPMKEKISARAHRVMGEMITGDVHLA